MNKLLTLAAIGMLCSVMANAVDARGRVDMDDVVGNRFVLTTANGEKPAGEREVFFQIDAEGMMFGRVCNNFRGKAELKGEILAMRQAISTRMMCMDGGLSALENKFLHMMDRGALVSMAGDALTLRRDGDTLVFTKTEPKEEPSAPADKKSGEAQPDIVSADDLVGRKFVLTKADGADFVLDIPEQQPYIEFADKMVISGNAGNNFSGSGSLENGTLMLKNAAATLKLSANPKLNDYERDFHTLLQGGAKITLSGNTLVLSDDSHTYVYELE